MLNPQAMTPDATAARALAKRKAQARAAFLRQTLRWHWISAAICLVGMLMFAITGITLNHAGAITASPRTAEQTATLPAAPLAALRASETAGGPLPDAVRAWLGKTMKVKAPAGAAIEWSDGEAYIALPRPGGDGWVSIDTGSGEVTHERTDRGWIAYLNDLHKGRNTGPAWSWFIDIFAIGAVVFCVTGLLLLQLHSKARPSTWPLVGLGLVVPLLLAILFIH
jgi:hypothetical protein